MCIRDSPKLQRRLDRNTRHPRSPNHGDRWIQTIEESATVVLVSVIPGRAEGADPESRCNLRILVWIPGSHAARAPRNDRLGQPSPTFLNALLIQEPWFSFGTAPPDVTS